MVSVFPVGPQVDEFKLEVLAIDVQITVCDVGER